MQQLQDFAVSLASDYLLPHLKKATNTVMNVPKDVADMKNTLNGIQGLIHEKDKVAAAEEDKAKVKQLVETCFHMEDIVDEYTVNEEKQLRDDPRCVALPCKAVDSVKATISRVKFAYLNEGVKLEFGENMSSNGSDVASLNSTVENLRVKAPRYIEEVDVVGFKDHEKKLIKWLIDPSKLERTVICVVGTGGVGKTTLAYKVFNKQEVREHFKHHVLWITVSRSYTEDGVLKDMLKMLKVDPSLIDATGGTTLIDQVRNHLGERYVVVFDDVWDENFWENMRFALTDNKNGSRILITTRYSEVANCCRSSCFVKVLELKPLLFKESFELFCKKAFGYDSKLNGVCPDNLRDVSTIIVERCKGLPLAIVAIGGLLARKNSRDASEWEKINQRLSSELENEGVTEILGLSYHDLSYNLKQCLLYFGIYPEDYEVERGRLIRQWVAEGFVKFEANEELEEVAEEYLTELIHRSLVQVSSFTSDGKPKSCRVHDVVRELILKKIEDLSFCHFVNVNGNLSGGGEMVRRLTIASGSNSRMVSEKHSNIRSLQVFGDKELSDSFVKNIPTRYRLLKVLDLEEATLGNSVPEDQGATVYNYVPENLGDFFLLRYLSFRNTKISNLPSSIGMLHNLETLDLRQTKIRKMPKEINKLKKLRHLLAYDTSKGVGYGIQMENGIGDLESLQTLLEVETNHGGVERIQEIERLTQLRVLGLTNVKQEFSNGVCSLIKRMQHMEKLYIAAAKEDEIIDLHFNASEPVLRIRKIRLVGKLNRFPNLVSKVQHLVMLSLSHSKLTDDPLPLLKDLPNLLCLSILYRAYEGECLHFPTGGFQKVEKIVLRRLYKLNSIRIDDGTLSCLKKLKLVNIPKLTQVPSGVDNLPKLEVFHVINMSNEFEESFHLERGKGQWIVEQVPFVSIVDRFWE